MKKVVFRKYGEVRKVLSLIQFWIKTERKQKLSKGGKMMNQLL